MGARTRANWHLDVLDDDDADPFHAIPDLGRPIDLRVAPSELHRQLADTLKIESELFHRQVLCAIKDDPQACCVACPVRHTDPHDPFTELCNVGVRQDRLLTTLAVGKHRGP